MNRITPLVTPEPAPLVGESVGLPTIDWATVSANSANSAAGYTQRATLPLDSILMDWFNFARERTEGADCYLAGTILPIVGALLGRRVWTQLGGNKKYPNLFSLV